MEILKTLTIDKYKIIRIVVVDHRYSLNKVDMKVYCIIWTFLTGTTDEAKRVRFRQKVTDYIDRAEKLKAHIEDEKQCMCHNVIR